MKPICFIAARGGSKGVPRKNIKHRYYFTIAEL